MAEPGLEPLDAQMRKLRDRSRDHAGELRSLDERVRAMEKRAENLSRAVAALARKSEIQQAVSEALAARSVLNWKGWQLALGGVALIPPYVGMLLVLADAIRNLAH